jgi:hypothetical protein
VEITHPRRIYPGRCNNARRRESSCKLRGSRATQDTKRERTDEEGKKGKKGTGCGDHTSALRPGQPRRTHREAPQTKQTNRERRGHTQARRGGTLQAKKEPERITHPPLLCARNAAAAVRCCLVLLPSALFSLPLAAAAPAGTPRALVHTRSSSCFAVVVVVGGGCGSGSCGWLVGLLILVVVVIAMMQCCDADTITRRPRPPTR